MHLSASIFYSCGCQPNTREGWGKGSKVGRVSNVFDVRHRVIRIEREEADHCLAKQRACLRIINQSPRLSASADNNENGVTWCVKHRSIRLSSFKKETRSCNPARINLSHRPFPLRKSNVIFIRFEAGKRKIFFYVSRYIRNRRQIFDELRVYQTCFCTLRVYIYTLLRNSNWHASARYGYATRMQTKR